MSFRKDIITTFVTRFSGSFFAIVSSVFLARLLGVEGKGEYALFITSANLFVLLFGLGLGHSLTYYIAKEELEEKVLLSTLFIQSFLFSLFFFLIVHLFHSFGIYDFFLPENKSYIIYELLLTGCVFVTLLFRNIAAILIGKKDFNAVNSVNLIVTISPLIIYSAYFFFQQRGVFKASIETIFLTHFFLISSNLLIILSFYFKRGGVRPALIFVKKSTIKKLLAFAGITYVASIAQFLNYKIDYWFVNYFADTKELGIYSLSAGLVQMVWLLPQSIAAVVFPNIAKENQNQEKRILTLSKHTLVIMLLGGLFSFFFSDYIIPLLYGDEFAPAANLFNILLLGAIPFCIGIIISGYFLGVGKPKIPLFASIIGCSLTILLDLVLIAPYGSLGAAIASACSYLSSSIFLFYMFWKTYKAKI